MRNWLPLFLSVVVLCSSLAAQSPKAPGDAAKSIQPTQTPATPTEPDGTAPQPAGAAIKIPAGTPLDIEAAHTVDSSQVQSGDLLSFLVLIPLKIDGVIVIEKGALVTARVVDAKRGGHWGHAGRLAWTMQDVIAVDDKRIPIRIGVEPAKGDDRSGVKGVSHGKEVATKTIVMGALLAPVFPIAPLALMQGFKRGENAVLPEGSRFVVFVSQDSSVKVTRGR